MATADCERAIEDATKYGNALLKFISRNDASVTGHQAGFYLPKAKDVWKMYTALKPIKGRMDEEIVRITWQDGRATDSKLTWYGNFAKKKDVPGRSEYRLTRFGKDFPFLNSNTVGHLFVLIPTGTKTFNAYVLDTEDDIEEIQAVLGIEAFDRFKQAHPDLILMDISLPEVDGLTATKAIRELEAGGENIPIIAVTAFGNLYYKKAIEAGCNELIEKPVDFDSIEPVIHHYLEE